MKSFQTILYHVSRLIVGAVFVYASLDKIVHPQAFAQAVYNHQILGGDLINLTAIILPWLELILGGCLFFNRWMKGASMLTALLMAAFISIVSFNLYRGLDVGCGCFSTDSKDPMDIFTLLRDSLILGLSLILALLVFRRDQRPFSETADLDSAEIKKN